MLFAAKCYWPEVTPAEILKVAKRATQETMAAYQGSLLFPDDDLVLCIFEAPSRTAVRQASESAGIPYERVMGSIWLSPRCEKGSTPWSDSLPR
jgi:hypothetical protein